MVVYDAAAVSRCQRERQAEALSASDEEFETALAIPSDIKLDWPMNSRTSAHLELTMGRIGFGMAATLNHDFMVDNQNQRYWAVFYGNSFMSHFRETPTLGALSSWDALPPLLVQSVESLMRCYLYFSHQKWTSSHCWRHPRIPWQRRSSWLKKLSKSSKTCQYVKK